MVENALRWILQHKKRKLIVIILTLLTGVLLVLPAVEEYSAAKERFQTAHGSLAKASRQKENLPELKSEFVAKKRQLEQLESKAVTEKNVEQLRELLISMIRETGCDMRTVTITDSPAGRPWMTQDSPIRGAFVGNAGKETPFQLLSWPATVRVEGEMANIYRFLAKVNQLDRFIHAKEIKLNRSDSNENLTQLEMQVEMFDLARKKKA